MKNIVILDGLTLGEIQIERLKEFGNVEYYETTMPNEVKNRIKDANIIFTNKVALNESNLNEADKLELICETATGFNNIDIKYAKEKNIAVTNVAGYSTNTVVQHTFATALALVDEIEYYDDFVKSGRYSTSPIFTCLNKPFMELEGKVWGIVGLGNIGKRVALVAESLGMKVVYYSTSGRNNSNEYKRVDLNELLRESDIISIHAPLNDNTLGLFNYDNISKMKNTAILVNMGRGPIVVEKDLARAIDEEIIKGAALDVFEVEPMTENNPLLSVKNKERLIMTPHIAWASVEARERLFNETIENIKAFYNGEIRNRVDL